MTYINSNLTIETNFFNRSEIAEQIEQEITSFKRLANRVTDAKKRQFFLSIEKAEKVYHVHKWYEETGKEELAANDIVWSGHDFGLKLFGVKKQSISKSLTTWKIVLEDSEAPNKFYSAVKDYQRSTGESAKLSIEAFKKWHANGEVLAEQIAPTEEAEVIEDASNETSETESTETEESAGNTDVSLTLKFQLNDVSRALEVISLRRTDNVWHTHNSKAEILRQLAILTELVQASTEIS